MTDFRNCVEITEALGYDPKRYNPVGVASFRVKLAGFTLTDTDPEWSANRLPVARRFGVDAADLPFIVEHNEHYENKRRWGEWESRRSAAQMIVDYYAERDPATRKHWLTDPDQAFDNVGPEPDYDQAILDAALARRAARTRRVQIEANAQAEASATEIEEAIADYTGPIKTRGQGKGYPKLTAFRKFLGRTISKAALWKAWDAR